MGQGYSHSTKWEKITAVILHIYGARAISYYFMMTKTLYQSNGNKNILTNIYYENISKALRDNDIHTLQNGRKYCGNSSYLWS